MNPTAAQRRKGDGRFGGWLRFGLVAAALTVPCVVPNSAGAQEAPVPEGTAKPDKFGGMDAVKLRAAGLEARSIREEAQRIDANNDVGAFEAFVKGLERFYRTATRDEVADQDPRAAVEFSREYTLAFLWEVLTELPSDVGPGEFKEPLNGENLARFRKVLVDILETADADLTYLQRTRAYKLARVALTAQNSDGVDALERLAVRLGSEAPDYKLIVTAVAQIVDAHASAD